jgi:urea transport system ATP-binding protein
MTIASETAKSTPVTGSIAAVDAGTKEPLLDARHVDLFYGASQALWSVSLSAEVGKVTALMGRNGVGKTSFLRAVVGEQAIGGGDIRLDGKSLCRMAPHERARLGIGYVPQGRDIFPLLTVKENLETGFAPLKRGERSIPGEVFELVPVLDSMLRRRGGDLSGGQQQQLAIARALVTRPRLLVLDEPTEGIQPSIIKDIGRAIEMAARPGHHRHPACRAIFRLRPPAGRYLRGDGPRPDRAVGHPRRNGRGQGPRSPDRVVHRDNSRSQSHPCIARGALVRAQPADAFIGPASWRRL